MIYRMNINSTNMIFQQTRTLLESEVFYFRIILMFLIGICRKSVEERIVVAFFILGKKSQGERGERMTTKNYHTYGFVHFGSLKDKYIKDKEKAFHFYGEIMEQYIKVNKESESVFNKNPEKPRWIIPLVFIYVDSAFQELAKDPSKIRNENFLNDLIREEFKLIHFLKEVEDSIFFRFQLDKNEFKSPFVYIGLNFIIELLQNFSTSTSLLELTKGLKQTFAYDSPKFIEAILRLGLQIDYDRIIARFDEDVFPTYEGINNLLNDGKNGSFKNTLAHPRKKYYHFSGLYNCKNFVVNPKLIINTVINKYAVRLNWIFRPENHKDYEDYTINVKRNVFPTEEKGIYDFFGALAEDGASQENQAFLKTKTFPYDHIRPQAQEISGAGLILSRSIIEIIPPFMNFDVKVTWIDDFVKRILIEYDTGWLDENDIESVEDAIFFQDRHPNGTGKSELEKWNKNNYFERLISGCLMVCLLKDKSHTYTKSIISYCSTGTYPASSSIHSDLKTFFDSNLDRILNKWKKIRVGGFPLQVIEEWADDFDKNPRVSKTTKIKKKDQLIHDLVDDCVDYLRLISLWTTFVSEVDSFGISRPQWILKYKF